MCLLLIFYKPSDICILNADYYLQFTCCLIFTVYNLFAIYSLHAFICLWFTSWYFIVHTVWYFKFTCFRSVFSFLTVCDSQMPGIYCCLEFAVYMPFNSCGLHAVWYLLTAGYSMPDIHSCLIVFMLFWLCRGCDPSGYRVMSRVYTNNS